MMNMPKNINIIFLYILADMNNITKNMMSMHIILMRLKYNILITFHIISIL